MILYIELVKPKKGTTMETVGVERFKLELSNHRSLAERRP